MTEEEWSKSISKLKLIIKNYDSMKDFANVIGENVSDISRWKSGRKRITTRAIISICRLYDIQPHELNADIFPKDLKFVFKDKVK